MKQRQLGVFCIILGMEVVSRRCRGREVGGPHAHHLITACLIQPHPAQFDQIQFNPTQFNIMQSIQFDPPQSKPSQFNQSPRNPPTLSANASMDALMLVVGFAYHADALSLACMPGSCCRWWSSSWFRSTSPHFWSAVSERSWTRTEWKTLPGCMASRDGWGRWKRCGLRSRTTCAGLRSGWSRMRRR